jgi:calcineurin-like phosphoesterase family protein
VSGRTWVAADHHFGHRNILNFLDADGDRIRGSVFADIEAHDDGLVERHNAVVADNDRVYLLGDVAINRRALSTLHRLKGRLVLVKGNHDIFNLKDYLPFFDDIRSCVVQKDHDGNKVILTHIPVHPDCLGRFGTNIHGHLHQNKLQDPNYICVSLEHTNYQPIEIHEALKLRGLRV